jgi:hypothetical protein
MTDEVKFSAAVERLQQTFARVRAGQYNLPLEPTLTQKSEVLDQFQPLFAPDHLPALTESEFRSFLLFKNNRHWSGLHRLGSRICADMAQLRRGLAVLLDEAQPIDKRYDYAIQQIKGMGRAVATAILQVMHPDKYGVWNSTSEGGLKAIELWPDFDRGELEGIRYVKINAILLRLAQTLSTDLWTLDVLWYYLQAEQPDGIEGLVEPDPIEEAPVAPAPLMERQRFGLERYLHEFLRDNWDRTELGKDWMLYREPGNEFAGYEYPCGVGRIDLLARHRHDGSWMVVELKRDQTGDQTLGQVMRYMGWVKRHLTEADEAVRGLIIAHAVDDSLLYAASMAPTVDLRLYEVEFHLRPAPEPAT